MSGQNFPAESFIHPKDFGMRREAVFIAEKGCLSYLQHDSHNHTHAPVAALEWCLVHHSRLTNPCQMSSSQCNNQDTAFGRQQSGYPRAAAPRVVGGDASGPVVVVQLRCAV